MSDLVDAWPWLLSQPVLGLLILEFNLLMRDSRRAELLADDLAARARSERIDDELPPLRPAIAAAAIDRSAGALYSG